MTERKNTKHFRFLSLILSCCFVLLYVLFAAYYITHSRDELLADFLGKDNCIYRQQKFVSQTFTEGLKQTGNLWCVFCIPLAVLFSFFVSRLKVQMDWRARLGSLRGNAPWLLALLVLCSGLGVYGCRYNVLCTDEAFSALNFAEQPVQQLWAYYPLPNNHIFYNLLNHFAAGISGDAIRSGRVLSILFYSLLICSNFCLFYHFTRNRFISFLCSVLLALQFLIWGFGHQARGYALSYLLQWGGFFSFYDYFFGKGKPKSLLVLLCCNIVGTWTIPTYLYLIMFQCCSALLLMIKRRLLYLQFWSVMLLSGAGVCLVFLPVFCYSGFNSVFGSGYDTGQSYSELWDLARHYFYEVASVQTFNFLDLLKPLATSFFLLPFILWGIFRKSLKKYSGLLFLYVLLWCSLLLMSMLMRHLPIMRGIGFHQHFSLLLLLLLSGTLVQQVRQTRGIVHTGFAALVILCAVRMFNYNKEFSPADLYGQNTKAFFRSLQEIPHDFPPGTRIWLPDECFMWPYIIEGRGRMDIYDCNFRNQEILFLSEDDKPLPESILSLYRLRSEGGGFKVFERKGN